MKKSFLSIMSFALQIVNLALMLVLIFAFVPTMNKMNNLISQICSAVDLELENSFGDSPVTVNIDNLITYDLEEDLTFALATGVGQPTHYAVANITLIMDTTHEDYQNYGTAEKLAERVSLIKSTIRNVFASYTLEQAKGNEAVLSENILSALHALYQSDFIYDVQFSSILFQ